MDKVLTLFTQPLACHPDYYKALKLSLFTALRNGTLQSFATGMESTPPTLQIGVLNDTLAIQLVEDYEITDPGIPENSIAVINVEGMLYPYKSFRIEQFVKAANSNPNIIGILFFVNTPGGYIHRVDITSKVIKQSEKPTAVYVTGVCASAGMYLFCGADRIFSASELDTIGSIGTKTTFVNDSKFWEENGFINTDIYATLSTHKNNAEREAKKGNFDPIVANLDFCNDKFHKTISEHRNIPIDPKSDVYNGADFFAQKAIELGLIDEIADLDTALNWVMMEGMKWKANQ